MANAFVPYTDQSSLIRVPEIERGELTGALMGVVTSIRTMNRLLATENRHGDGYSEEMIEGIYSLIAQQTHILAAVTNEVHKLEDARRADDKADAVERSGVSDSVRKVREAFIVASAEAGATSDVIAQALHMRRASIERIIGQLQGRAPVAPKPAHAASA